MQQGLPTSGAISMTSGIPGWPADDCSTLSDRSALSDRIAITGMGVVSPIGQGVEAFWSGLINGVSGITPIERFPTHDLRVGRGGEVKQLQDTQGLERPLPACRASQFLILAATEATRMARLPEAVAAGGRVGVVIGSALGGIAEAERWHDQPR